MTNDLEKLVSILCKSGLEIKNGQLLVTPAIAKRYGPQIKKLKPEIMKYFGRCPACGGELVVRVEDLAGKTRRHAHCPIAVGHYDKWER